MVESSSNERQQHVNILFSSVVNKLEKLGNLSILKKRINQNLGTGINTLPSIESPNDLDNSKRVVKLFRSVKTEKNAELLPINYRKNRSASLTGKPLSRKNSIRSYSPPCHSIKHNLISSPLVNFSYNESDSDSNLTLSSHSQSSSFKSNLPLSSMDTSIKSRNSNHSGKSFGRLETTVETVEDTHVEIEGIEASVVVFLSKKSIENNENTSKNDVSNETGSTNSITNSFISTSRCSNPSSGSNSKSNFAAHDNSDKNSSFNSNYSITESNNKSVKVSVNSVKSFRKNRQADESIDGAILTKHLSLLESKGGQDRRISNLTAASLSRRGSLSVLCSAGGSRRGSVLLVSKRNLFEENGGNSSGNLKYSKDSKENKETKEFKEKEREKGKDKLWRKLIIICNIQSAVETEFKLMAKKQKASKIILDYFLARRTKRYFHIQSCIKGNTEKLNSSIFQLVLYRRNKKAVAIFQEFLVKCDKVESGFSITYVLRFTQLVKKIQRFFREFLLNNKNRLIEMSLLWDTCEYQFINSTLKSQSGIKTQSSLPSIPSLLRKNSSLKGKELEKGESIHTVIDEDYFKRVQIQFEVKKKNIESKIKKLDGKYSSDKEKILQLLLDPSVRMPYLLQLVKEARMRILITRRIVHRKQKHAEMIIYHPEDAYRLLKSEEDPFLTSIAKFKMEKMNDIYFGGTKSKPQKIFSFIISPKLNIENSSILQCVKTAHEINKTFDK